MKRLVIAFAILTLCNPPVAACPVFGKIRIAMGAFALDDDGYGGEARPMSRGGRISRVLAKRGAIDRDFAWTDALVEVPASEMQREPDPDDIVQIGWWEAHATNWTALETWLNREITIAHEKLGMGVDGFTQALSNSQRERLKQWTHLVPHVQLSLILDLYPEINNEPEFEEIAHGRWDGELRAIARLLIETGHEDAILRLWHEPELPFREWCEDPFWVSAWRRVHDVFSNVPGAAFKWQYSVNGPAAAGLTASDGRPWLEKCYPGRTYIDDVSVGMYNFDRPMEETLARAARVRDFALAHGHTFSSAEWGLWGENCQNYKGAGDNPEFVRRVYRFMTGIPIEYRGYLLYFGHHECVNLDRFPRSKTEMKKLFGG